MSVLFALCSLIATTVGLALAIAADWQVCALAFMLATLCQCLTLLTARRSR